MAQAGNRPHAEEQDAWRRDFMRLLGILFLAVGTLVLAQLVVRQWPLHWVHLGYFASIGLGQVVSVVRVSPRRRAHAYVIGLLGIAATSAISGFTPNIAALIIAAVVSAAVLMGLRASLLTLAASVVILVGAFGLITAGLVPGQETWLSMLAPRDPLVMLRVLISLSALGLIVAFGVSRVLELASRGLVERREALEALGEEVRRRQQAQAELVRREAALAQARELELLGRLAAHAAHDFNNALLVLMVELEALRAAPGTPVPSETVELMEQAVQQAATTARQLRSFGRIEHRAVRAVPLGPFLEGVQRLLARILPVRVKVVLEPVPEALVVLADDGLLQRVLVNLALNARDAMPEGGQLTIRARAPTEAERSAASQWVVVEVADTGCGMDAQTLERVFDPFFTTKGAGGTGLGLSSVKSLVEETGGWVDIDSVVGKGTCVRFSWPRTGTGEGDARLDAQGVPALQAALVVDDDAAVRKVTVRALQPYVSATVEAQDTHEALERLRRFHGQLSLLVTDWDVPGPPVRELIAEFRRLQPQGKVLLSSGSLDIDGAVDVDGRLTKPFDAGSLAASVRQVMTGGAPRALPRG